MRLVCCAVMNFANSRRHRAARQGARRSERGDCDDEQRRMVVPRCVNYQDSLRGSALATSAEDNRPPRRRRPVANSVLDVERLQTLLAGEELPELDHVFIGQAQGLDLHAHDRVGAAAITVVLQ